MTGLVIQVNHTNYGTLFAAMIKGSGSLITTENEEGEDIPFLTTEEILKQIMKFGFYVKYDVKSNLPSDIVAYLSTLYNLGYDKITQVIVYSNDRYNGQIRNKRTLVFKSEGNSDLLSYGYKLSETKLAKSLATNTVLNVTNECDGIWEWVDHVYNISDILDENLDPSDPYTTDTGVAEGEDVFPLYPPFPPTPYSNSENEESEYTMYSDESEVEDDEP